MTACTPLTDLPAFGALQRHAAELRNASIPALFDQDPRRSETFSASAAGLHLDYSKQSLDLAARDTLLQLASQAKLAEQATALLSGAMVNVTEQRPALHSLLRARQAPGLTRQMAAVSQTRKHMQDWVCRLHEGRHRGFSGALITDVVSIGIGGSDLGPRLVTEALTAFHGPIACHYVANVDPADLQNVLLDLDPASTFFILCSKSFRTEETLANAVAARNWLTQSGADEQGIAQHFLAVSTNLEAAAQFGIPASQCLPLWDWVGGRYSVWSAVGLSCAIALGWEHFDAFLNGAAEMDRHFQQAAPAENLPMLLSLLEIWNCNGLGASNHAVLPYDQGLRKLPDFLQQLSMESNGKSVLENGKAVPMQTAPILWGAAGTMGQHSFHQLLHQGTRLCPSDFILPLRTHTGMHEQHRRLVANCLAQSRALLVGRNEEAATASLLARGKDASLASHLVIPGNRPHSIISFNAVTPGSLGALLALYEHKTFCSGRLWGIDSFDQWGVELGKEIGTSVLARLAGEHEGPALDPSTEALIQRWQAANPTSD